MYYLAQFLLLPISAAIAAADNCATSVAASARPNCRLWHASLLPDPGIITSTDHVRFLPWRSLLATLVPSAPPATEQPSTSAAASMDVVVRRKD